VKILKCDLCGATVGYDGPPPRPHTIGQNGALIDKLFCDECAIDWLRWVDEEGKPTEIGRSMERAGWIRF
jgi:hypothetical protein